MPLFCRILLCLCCALASAGRVRAEEVKPAVPAMEDIQSFYDRRLYPETLWGLAQALAIGGEAARAYDRHALLLLKFETHLQMRAVDPALAALRESVEETDDPQAKALAATLEALFKQSKGLSFTAKPQDKDDPPLAFDLVDPDKRRVALETFVAEEMAAAEERADEAARSKSLPPVVESLGVLKRVGVYELAVTGKTERSDEMRSRLSARGHELLKKHLSRLIRRVDTIDRNADEMIRRRKAEIGRGRIRTYRSTIDSARRRGLTSAERAELRRIVAGAADLQTSVVAYGNELGLNEDDLEALIDQTKELKRQAEKTIQDEMEQ